MTEKQFVEAVARILVLEYKMTPEEALEFATDNWTGSANALYGRSGISFQYGIGTRTNGWEHVVKDAANMLAEARFADALDDVRTLVESVRERMEMRGWKDEEIRVLLRDATPLFLKARRFAKRGRRMAEIAIYNTIVTQYGTLPRHVSSSDE
jgi:hypothetical protein